MPPEQVGDIADCASAFTAMAAGQLLVGADSVTAEPTVPLETDRLRESLAQREAALLRQEGENFLLGAQVQQLKQQAQEASREAQLCVAQLAQALQLLEIAGPRAPLKSEVDRARALVKGARRSLLKLPCVDPGSEHNSVGRGGVVAGTRSVTGTDRRSSPQGRPRSPRAPVGTGQQRSNELAPGLAASAVAAVAESDGKTAPSFATPRMPSRVQEQRSARSAAKTNSGAFHDKEQRSRRSPLGGTVGTASVRTGGGSVALDGDENSAINKEGAVNNAGGVASTTAMAGTTEAQQVNSTQRTSETSEVGTADLVPLQQQFLRQRELLVRVLRKSASLEEEMTTLRDDLTRRDVVIHNLRQEVQLQQQEVQQQHQQFEQQQQQLQAQHQLQQIQQLQQLQELQRLLQQQQLQQRQLQWQQVPQEQQTVETPQQSSEVGQTCGRSEHDPWEQPQSPFQSQ